MIVQPSSPGLGVRKTCATCGETGHNSRRHRSAVPWPIKRRAQPVARVAPEDVPAYLKTQPRMKPYRGKQAKVTARWLFRSTKVVYARSGPGTWAEAKVIRDPELGPMLEFVGGNRIPMLQDGKGVAWASTVAHASAEGCPCPGCLERRVERAATLRAREEKRAAKARAPFVPKMGAGAIYDVATAKEAAEGRDSERSSYLQRLENKDEPVRISMVKGVYLADATGAWATRLVKDRDSTAQTLTLADGTVLHARDAGTIWGTDTDHWMSKSRCPCPTCQKNSRRRRKRELGILSPADELVCTKCLIRGHLLGDPDLCIQRAEDYARQQAPGAMHVEEAA